ncbi:MAG: DUF2917 domain-containing protein [Burkholderiaceae bacterium]|nr:DUF2917 domain-containing protein [Pseudomonadota bacterium]MBS0595913.1 DUF2917 domain-containing protein [Pseudomonadota bacterium]MCO5117679.1 DUF2917 domain-containing protein [Burkholderiaceae bacterium]MCP5216541.1 DUF2917 domain-containing protein [Burkholderiaceae bacterium]
MSAATLHSSPSLFLSQGVGVTLQPGQARTLRVPAAGQLRVTQGALWVTRRGRHPSHAPDDLYVAADAPLALCAGETVVIEPIHLAQASAAQVAPVAFHWQPAAGRCAGALRWLRERLQARAAPAHARA